MEGEGGERADGLARADLLAGPDQGGHRKVGGVRPAVHDGHHRGAAHGPGEPDPPRPGGQHGVARGGGEVDAAVPGEPALCGRGELPQHDGGSPQRPGPRAGVGAGGGARDGHGRQGQQYQQGKDTERVEHGASVAPRSGASPGGSAGCGQRGPDTSRRTEPQRGPPAGRLEFMGWPSTGPHITHVPEPSEWRDRTHGPRHAWWRRGGPVGASGTTGCGPTARAQGGPKSWPQS